MTAPTYKQFVTDFPEFSKPSIYPLSTVQFWLNVAGVTLNARWNDSRTDGSVTMLYLGTELFVAHNLLLNKQAAAGAAKGVNSGVGLAAGKTVGPVSVTYDNSLATSLKAGHWGLTTYGMRFIALAQMVGSGPIQVGIGSMYSPLTPIPQGAGWFGPMVDQGWGLD